MAWLIMPASACAAFPNTCREMRFRPATSVTEYNIAMSDGPTYALTSPDATVDTITFGTPTARARIDGVINAVPPDPPAPTIPPRSVRERTNCVSASDIASTDVPRSPVKTESAPAG
jgi:hypothetical protein